ncbi:O-antigen polymerase [Vibrio breoganii]
MSIFDISLVGIVSFIGIVVITIRKPLVDSITNPVVYVLFAHVYFLGIVPVSLENKLFLEVLLLISFIVFIFSLSAGYKFGQITFLNQRYFYKSVEGENSLHSKSDSYLIKTVGFVICWSLFSTIYNAYVFGGIEYSLVRMYYFQPINAHNKLLFLFDRVGSKLALCAICAITYLSVRYNKSWKFMYLAFLFFCFAVIPTGSRGNIIIALLVMIMGFFMAYRSQRYINPLLSKRSFVLIILVLICFQIFNVMTLNRNTNLIEENIAFQTLDTKMQYTVNTVDEVPIIVKYIDRIVEQYGTSRDYIYGHTFYSIAVNLIPRSIWSEKPIGIGRILAINDSGNVDTPVSFAASYSGEGWANGGWIGMVAVSIFAGFVTGFLCRFCDALRDRMDNLLDLIKFVLFFNGTIMFIRGDMLSGWAASIYPIVLFYIILICVNKMKWLLVRISN